MIAYTKEEQWEMYIKEKEQIKLEEEKRKHILKIGVERGILENTRRNKLRTIG